MEQNEDQILLLPVLQIRDGTELGLDIIIITDRRWNRTGIRYYYFYRPEMEQNEDQISLLLLQTGDGTERELDIIIITDRRWNENLSVSVLELLRSNLSKIEVSAIPVQYCTIYLFKLRVPVILSKIGVPAVRTVLNKTGVSYWQYLYLYCLQVPVFNLLKWFIYF